jgi:tRNA threonylcarbamoyladenosine biosynthesis protein TsaB
MILYIDSTDFKKITYAVVGEKVIRKTYNVDPQESYKTLGYLEKFLAFAKVKDLHQLKKIIVNGGPGSYTGVRVGVTHAEAIGLVLNVPVSVVPSEKFKII